MLKRFRTMPKSREGVGIALFLARVVPVAFLSCQFGGGGVPLNLTKLADMIHEYDLRVHNFHKNIIKNDQHYGTVCGRSGVCFVTKQAHPLFDLRGRQLCVI